MVRFPLESNRVSDMGRMLDHQILHDQGPGWKAEEVTVTLSENIKLEIPRFDM